MTREECTWWVNHLFAVAKEAEWNRGHVEDAKEVETAQQMAIEALSAKADRPTGEWLVGDAWPHNVYCSNCYMTFVLEGWSVWEDGRLPRNYCPNCGARMKGKNDESNNSAG